MLSQFTVKNYKSIRDEITFDMQAVAISEHTKHIIEDTDGEKYLPVASIYGPNGGGKSNVLEALQVLVAKVIRPLYAATSSSGKEFVLKRIPVVPFAFSADTKNAPTEFEVFFRTETSEYRYILHVQAEQVIYERLDRVRKDTGRKSELFERKNGTITLKGVLGILKVGDSVSTNISLLSYLGITYSENEVVKEVMDWFVKGVSFLNYGNPFQEARILVDQSEDIKRLVLKIIKEMDLDIDDFRIEEEDNNRIEIYTKHIVDGNDIELKIEEESSGTRKIFGLLPFIAGSIVNGNTLIIDEMDAKIHPVLLKYIIELFTDREKNRRGAQLIFTSHDLSTMNNEVFRRDEIWFVAKGRSQNSKLYSLVEFKNNKGESVRKDAKYDKQYLEGKYGADPYLQKIIDWSRPNA
ncbi:MAG: ATP-binding protein [Lachnospiraceae bacterium]|nr:ATP-binding protein [Lachnospiraceae bacterium]